MTLACLVGALMISMVMGVLVGAVPIAPGDVLGTLLGGDDGGPTGTIIRDLRLPRVVGAALVGAALAVAGALLQGLLRNPLADPFVTGTSAGATLFAVGAIALGASATLVPLCAFVGALAAVTFVWRLSALGGSPSVVTILLSGVVLTSFAGALVTLMLVASDRLTLRLSAVLGWLQGGVAVVNPAQLVMTALVIAAGLAIALVVAPRLDAFAFGEDTAATLGVDLGRVTALVLVATALLTGAAVALAGLVGFVGLIVPHAIRAIVGAPTGRMVLACAPAGASVLVLADLGARVILAPTEVPAGVLTGLLGAPFFLLLLARVRRVSL